MRKITSGCISKVVLYLSDLFLFMPCADIWSCMNTGTVALFHHAANIDFSVSNQTVYKAAVTP